MEERLKRLEAEIGWVKFVAWLALGGVIGTVVWSGPWYWWF